MLEIHAPEAMAAWTAACRRNGQTIGFVPTMGALHQGHLDLIRRAQAACDRVVCSIFVNPLQFNDVSDFENYPKRTQEDRALLESEGCHALFMPAKEGLFAGFQPVAYDLGGLDLHWEGPLRPGHFQGVVNVVQRLFSVVRADQAFFGEKDRQQLAILQWVAQAHHWPEAIIGCPTVREPDGLALSSRNLRLNEPERAAAGVLYKALCQLAGAASRKSLPECLADAADLVGNELLATLEYIGVADARSLAPLSTWPEHGGCVALIAARVGPVRLIDNLDIGTGQPLSARG